MYFCELLLLCASSRAFCVRIERWRFTHKFFKLVCKKFTCVCSMHYMEDFKSSVEGVLGWFFFLDEWSFGWKIYWKLSLRSVFSKVCTISWATLEQNTSVIGLRIMMGLEWPNYWVSTSLVISNRYPTNPCSSVSYSWIRHLAHKSASTDS